MSETLDHQFDDAVGAPITGSTYDRVTGMDIRIDRVGCGLPLVFLNGLLGQNEHWFPCLGPLAKRSQCILLQPPLLEMRGKGCSVEGVTRLIISVLETILESSAVLLGNSLGGHIALRVALERPDMVRGLVLIGSSGLFERTFDRKDVQHSPSYEWLERKISSLFFDPVNMKRSMVDRAYQELSQRSKARSLVKLGGSAKKDHLGEVLDQIEAPTLIVWGRQDSVTPPEVAEQFHSMIPNSKLVWVDKCGHAPQIERPHAVAEHISDFVDLLESGAFYSERNGEAQQEVA